MIYGYENEFTQAIINIISNSKDAFIELDISIKNIFINIELEDKNVVIEIIDNAGGIPKNIISKIFEPYFSTKEQGKGTGIGLYMTKTIITKHMNGFMDVYNNDIGGVTFKIIIPVSDNII
jgi:signal transduction histidine kinase